MDTPLPPAERRLRDSEAVHGYVGRICFKTGPPTTVGAELEWLPTDPRHPRTPVTIDRLHAALPANDPLPARSTISFEPGGQVELSSRPAEGLDRCWQALNTDVSHVMAALRSHGIDLHPTAIDPIRPPERLLGHPRYEAMAAYFTRHGPAPRVGETMMCSTAAVQVNLDAGADRADVERRWRLLDVLGPVLSGAFANSPVHAGRATGWKSTRQRVWQRLDPLRTGPPVGSDPVTAWAEYALDAPVMVIRRGSGQQWIRDPRMTFRQWIDTADPPTEDDLAYHLSTLFPPVRPRGWFEVRYIDAQSARWWPVPVAVLVGLLHTAAAVDSALDASAPAAGRWELAARHGPADPTIAEAAVRCFDVALGALRRAGTDRRLLALVEAYLERYLLRGRCPADDVLDRFVAPGNGREGSNGENDWDVDWDMGWDMGWDRDDTEVALDVE